MKNLFKKLPFIRNYTYDQHRKWWGKRKIDWDKDYLQTWTHPHRGLIVAVLKAFEWVSLWEVGCGPGANLVRIIKEMQGKQLGGSDINPDAIKLAEYTFRSGKFQCESSDDMLLSDSAVDVVLSDANLIYGNGKKVIKEMVRITRNNIVLCEFHSNSWWKRFKLFMRSGYHAYNYTDLLKDAGCYDIQMFKIPPEYWDSEVWQKYGYIITAKIAKK